MKALICLALALAITNSMGVENGSAPEGLLPLESFFTESTRFAERLSPCGGKVAYLAPDGNGFNHLWMVNANRLDHPKKISSAAATAVRAFFWIGNERLLWQSADTEGRTRLFLTDTERGETRNILPNEKRLIHLHGVAESEEPYVMAGLSDATEAFPDLYRVSLQENEAPVLAHTNRNQFITWAWDAQGTPVAALRWTDTGAKELLNLLENPVSILFRVEPSDDLRLVMASLDGRRVLVLTDHGSDFTHLEWICLATGTRHPFATDPMRRVDLEGLLSTGDDILAVSYSDETLRWHAQETAFSSTLESLNDSANPDCLNLLGIDKSRTRILHKRFSARDAGAVYLKDTKTGNSRLLWRERPGLDPSSLCDSRPIHYKARDGSRIPAYLTVPKGDKTPWPLVVFPHGGPRMRTHHGFDGRVQFLASRGYAVLQPNFRGSRGYGKAFMNAGNGQWGRGVMQTDVEDEVEHLVREGFADPQRVAIIGGSYGGYAALAGLTFTPDRFAAAVCLFGISDLPAYAAHSPIEWRAFSGDTARQLAGDSVAANPAALEALSPANYASASKAPLLIYHGAEDHLIPVAQARRMVAAMRKSGKPVDYLLATDEGHGFSRPESEMAVYRAIELFLRKHLGGNIGSDPDPIVARRLSGFRHSGAADAVR